MRKWKLSLAIVGVLVFGRGGGARAAAQAMTIFTVIANNAAEKLLHSMREAWIPYRLGSCSQPP
jgi:hypothetical protein